MSDDRSTMDVAVVKNPAPGRRGRSNAYLDELMPTGICLFSDYVAKNGDKYGIFVSPAKLHTNETETGVDSAMWCCEIKKNRKGVITRKPTIVKDPKHAKPRCFYQHIIIEWDLVHPFAEAILRLQGGDVAVENKREAMKPTKTEDEEIDSLMETLRILNRT